MPRTPRPTSRQILGSWVLFPEPVSPATITTGWAALVAATAGAADSPTHCMFTSTITLAPGLSVVPSAGTFSSGGETGTVSCDGPVRGIVPTGPGTLGVEGRYGTKDPSTCFRGQGEG